MTQHKPFRDLSDAEKGALLLAHHEGKRIEFYSSDNWHHVTTIRWCGENPYRVAPEPKTPDTIDWEHVSPEWNFMARDSFGNATFFAGDEPKIVGARWSGSTNSANINAWHFASYRRGTVEWQVSLVIRPGHEGKS